MSRYAVSMVLAVWFVLAMLGCMWVWAWTALLVPAIGVQAVASRHHYRRHR